MAAERERILIVDDSEEGLFALKELLEGSGYDVATASNGAEALKLLDSLSPAIILSDINMPVMDGCELVRRLKSSQVLRYIPVVLVSAKDNLEDVVAGLESGADVYIKKPFSSAELLARVRSALRMRRVYLELRRTCEANLRLSCEVRERAGFHNLIGKSEPMQQVYRLIETVAKSNVPVLLSGESGTGKELAAAAIHYNSERGNRPFVIQNCSAFNENLLESEFFGHVRGAFSGAVQDKEGLFQAADGGTFFLDELGEMSPALQVKLLRVLQDGTFTPVGSTAPRKVDVRILAATNRDLRGMVEAGAFRKDLFYRLNVVSIKLPPLRERRSDIPLFVEHFLSQAAKRCGAAKKRVTDELLVLLNDYGWPGNIRELQNEMERLVVLSGSREEIPLDLVSPQIIESSLGGPQETREKGSLREALENLERGMLASALERTNGNKSEAARELRISRSTLIAKVQAYGLE